MNWFYNTRETRSHWLTERFKNEIDNAQSLLDVGCYNADLKKWLPEKVKYTGVDIAGKPDFHIDLDKIERLPFDDKAFDVVICGDVLEHLEHIHLIFDELCRVCNKSLIITLPNGMASFSKILQRKKYTSNKEKQKQFGTYFKFYGLPLEPPEDRHRWFFNFEEATNFISYRSLKNEFIISSIESEWNHCSFSMQKLLLDVIFLGNKNLVHKNFITLLNRDV